MPLQDLMQQYAIEEGAESKAKDECSNQRRLCVDGWMLVAFARHEGRSEIARRWNYAERGSFHLFGRR
jgi:hypothetical protein